MIVQGKDVEMNGAMGGNSTWYWVTVLTEDGHRPRLLFEGKAQGRVYDRLIAGQAIPALMYEGNVAAISVDGRVESTDEDPDVATKVRTQRLVGSAVLLAFAIGFFTRAAMRARHHSRKTIRSD